VVKRTTKPSQHAKADASEQDRFGMERLLFFSDAVFAIAITLLALEIRLPASEEHLTNEELLQNILSIWPSYLGYILSFLVIGLFWMGHHRKFRLIRQYDPGLLRLNLLLLLGVAFTPFPSALLSEYGNRTATIFYALTMTIIGLLHAVVWIYAARNHRLIDSSFSPQQIRDETLRALITPGIFLLSIGLAFLDPFATVAKLSWLLTAVVLRFDS
jgi:uncharacterized membrane protein